MLVDEMYEILLYCFRFIYVADALAQEILVYTRTGDNSLAMHNVSAFHSRLPLRFYPLWIDGTVVF